MKCVFCHGEDIRIEEVEEKVQRGLDKEVIAVQAMVCQTCGERYYDRRAMRLLQGALDPSD